MSWDQLVVTSKIYSSVSQTRLSGFFSMRIEEALEYYCARDGSNTSLVSSRPYVQPEEEDAVDEGTKDEGGSGQEGER
jgi:hypothetical protein